MENTGRVMLYQAHEKVVKKNFGLLNKCDESLQKFIELQQTSLSTKLTRDVCKLSSNSEINQNDL